jgi:hypothetical protein
MHFLEFFRRQVIGLVRNSIAHKQRSKMQASIQLRLEGRFNFRLFARKRSQRSRGAYLNPSGALYSTH